MDLTVIIATYGSPVWRDLALDRAAPSARNQAQTIIHHDPGRSIAKARNHAAAKATTRWLCFLDADDELAPRYVEAMHKSGGDLRAPAVTWIDNGRETPPRILDDRHIEQMNPCVVGTLIRRDLFTALGGFREWPAWEDWALFLTAARRGAKIEHVPGAVYRAYVRKGSRNRTVADSRRLHAQIRRESW